MKNHHPSISSRSQVPSEVQLQKSTIFQAVSSQGAFTTSSLDLESFLQGHLLSLGGSKSSCYRIASDSSS